MHEIHYETADVNCNKKLVEGQLNSLCERNSDWGGGLPSAINWKDITLNSYEEAMQYIEDHDSSYAQIAVKYKDYPSLVKSKKYEDIAERLKVADKKHYDLSNAYHFKEHTSAYIGCKNCGSKISHKYLRSNYCPICRADLRPTSTLDRIKNLYESVNKLRAELKAEEQKLQAKQSKSAKEKWLIKIEYHC